MGYLHWNNFVGKPQWMYHYELRWMMEREFKNCIKEGALHHIVQNGFQVLSTQENIIGWCNADSWMPLQSAFLILIDNLVGIACNDQYYTGLPMETIEIRSKYAQWMSWLWRTQWAGTKDPLQYLGPICQ